MNLVKISVIALVIVVAALIFFRGEGDGTTFQISPTSDKMELPTQLPCSVAQDCIDAVLAEDPTATDVDARCEETCVLLIDPVPIAEDQQ